MDLNVFAIVVQPEKQHYTFSCNANNTKKITLKLLNSIYKLDPEIRRLSYDKLFHLLLYGSKLYSFEINREIVKLNIKIL